MQLLWFILLVGVLITVHELGHFLMARLFGVRIVRLSLGFGPPLLRIARGKTEYVIAAVPLGGYVRLLGSEPDDDIADADRPHAFAAKPLWQRLAILLAGPVANLLLPTVIYFHFFVGEEQALSATIGTVLAGQPASGVLAPGDRVVAIDGTSVRYWADVSRIVAASPGKDLRITVERPGEPRPLTKVVTARAHENHDALGMRQRTGLLGILPHYRLPQIAVLDTLEVAPGQTEPSPAARAGLHTFDIILAVQGRRVDSWTELERRLETSRGEPLVISYLRRQATPASWTAVARLEPHNTQLYPRLVRGAAGERRYQTGLRSGDLCVEQITPDSPVQQAGLKIGDCVRAIDETPLDQWETLEQELNTRRERPFLLSWQSPDGQEHRAELRLRAQAATEQAPMRWELGAAPRRATRPVPLIAIEGRVGWALGRAVATTASVTGTMLRILGRVVIGQVPMSTVGGPLAIYHLTGTVAARGSEQMLAMLAIVSLNIGILNLLPLPLLDGGQAMLTTLATARRRPLGRAMRRAVTYVGLLLLGLLVLIALRNDLLRFWPK